MDNANIAGTMNVPIFVGGRKVEFGGKQIPSPGSGQLLIKVKANTLCGSDRWQFEHGTRTTPGSRFTPRPDIALCSSPMPQSAPSKAEGG